MTASASISTVILGSTKADTSTRVEKREQRIKENQQIHITLISKNNQVELSSIIGYYNKIRLRNDSNRKVELFAVSVDVAQSSK